MFAVHHEDEWRHLETAKAVDRLRLHHRGVWDGRASMGTATHAVMEAWIHGQTVDLYKLVCEMAANDRQAKSWVGHEDEATVKLGGYVDGLEKFWHEWMPEDIDAEAVVRQPGVYIGQRDIVATMRGQRWLLDAKSTAEQDAEKAIYGDSWALQLVAYDRAPELVRYGWDEAGKLRETGTEPNERSDRHGIIHLRGDGKFTLFEVQANDAAYAVFYGLAKMAHWLDNVAAPVAVVV